jgi:hypothetical protein
MSTSINDPELGEILFVNNVASISEKATVADYQALRKAYDLVNDLQHEVEHLKLKLHESDSRSIYMGRLLAQTKEQLRKQSLVNFKNQVLFEYE